MKKLVALAVALSLLAGCAGPPPLHLKKPHSEEPTESASASPSETPTASDTTTPTPTAQTRTPFPTIAVQARTPRPFACAPASLLQLVNAASAFVMYTDEIAPLGELTYHPAPSGPPFAELQGLQARLNGMATSLPSCAENAFNYLVAAVDADVLGLRAAVKLDTVTMAAQFKIRNEAWFKYRAELFG